MLLAASLLTLVTAGAAGGLWVQRQWAAQAAATLRQRAAVESALEKTGDLRRHSRWAEMQAILEQTRDRLGEAGPADLRQRVEQALADVELVDRLEAIRMKRLAVINGKMDSKDADKDKGADKDKTANKDKAADKDKAANKYNADKDYAATFQEAGLGAEMEDAAAVAGRIRASALSEQLVAALDDWAAVTEDEDYRTWLLKWARQAADPDPARPFPR